MNEKIVAFVPIKLNSERLKNKNILPLLEKPLCWHIFEKLKNVELIDEIYVFCSNPIIKKYIPNYVQFLKRDPDLDKNHTKGNDIYNAFINQVDSDYYLLAHTTSPFIKSETISLACKKVLFENFDSVFSVKKNQTFAWYNNEPINYDLNNTPRTQDLKPIFIETSGFYLFKRDIFINFKRRIGFNPFLLEVDFIESIDIDTKEEYELAIDISKKNYRGVKNV